MGGLMFIGLILIAIVILDVLVQRYGVDSRSESRDQRSPVRGISV